MNQNIIIEQTQRWLTEVIIGNNFCPFAKQELIKNRIRTVCFNTISDANAPEASLQFILDELQYLDNNNGCETSLLVFPEGLGDFEDYLDLLAMAQQLLEDLFYDGTYQLASFHPQYCFEGCDNDDATNYTNRSPYPTIHIIREAGLELALERYPNPELIPENNIKKANQLGITHLKSQLADCLIRQNKG